MNEAHLAFLDSDGMKHGLAIAGENRHLEWEDVVMKGYSINVRCSREEPQSTIINISHNEETE